MMKHSRMVLAFVISFVSALPAASSAQASTLQGGRFSRMKLDPRLEEQLHVESASVLVDRRAGKIHLTLERAYDCRSEICAEVMPEPLLVSLPIVSVVKDECGRWITRAGSDELNGLTGLQQMVLVQMQDSVCGGVDASAPTVLTFQTGAPQRTVSKFEGPALEGMPEILPILE